MLLCGALCPCRVCTAAAHYRAAVSGLFWMAVDNLRRRPVRPKASTISPRELAKSLDWERCGRWVQWFLEYYELPSWNYIPVCVDHGADVVYPHIEIARLKAVVGDDHGVGDVASSDGSSADRSSRALRRQGSKRKLVPSE